MESSIHPVPAAETPSISPTYTTDPILLNGIRVLRPSEWEKLRYAMLTDEQRRICAELTAAGELAKANHIQRYQIICDILILTGMRIVEARRLQPDWYRPSRRVLVLPKGAHQKHASVFTSRTVMLSPPGCDAVDRYVSAKIPWPTTKAGFRASLIRYAIKAGISPVGITTKMFRKTLASWLMACYPEREMYISASMGHTRDILQRYYLGLGFERSEVEKMREYLKEWGMLV
jgi:integrase